RKIAGVHVDDPAAGEGCREGARLVAAGVGERDVRVALPAAGEVPVGLAVAGQEHESIGIGEEATGRVHGATVNATISPRACPASMVRRPTVIGSLKRRGPALPGLN